MLKAYIDASHNEDVEVVAGFVVPDPRRPIHFSFATPRENPRLQAADVISNASLRWGVMDLVLEDGEPQFIASIKPDCQLP
jgi:hypothetical protein